MSVIIKLRVTSTVMLTTDQRHFSTKRYDFYSSVLHYVTQKGYEGCQ